MKLCDPSLLAKKTKEQSLVESKFVLVIMMLLSTSFSEETYGSLQLTSSFIVRGFLGGVIVCSD